MEPTLSAQIKKQNQMLELNQFMAYLANLDSFADLMDELKLDHSHVERAKALASEHERDMLALQEKSQSEMQEINSLNENGKHAEAMERMKQFENSDNGIYEDAMERANEIFDSHQVQRIYEVANGLLRQQMRKMEKLGTVFSWATVLEFSETEEESLIDTVTEAKKQYKAEVVAAEKKAIEKVMSKFTAEQRETLKEQFGDSYYPSNIIREWKMDLIKDRWLGTEE